MNELSKTELKIFLTKDTFKNVLEQYRNSQIFDNIKAVCFNDEKYLKPFVMGVVYSSCCSILQKTYPINEHESDSDIKEMILLIRDWTEV